VQRLPPLRVPRRHVRPCAHQHPHDFRVDAEGCDVERCSPVPFRVQGLGLTGDELVVGVQGLGRGVGFRVDLSLAPNTMFPFISPTTASWPSSTRTAASRPCHTDNNSAESPSSFVDSKSAPCSISALSTLT